MINENLVVIGLEEVEKNKVCKKTNMEVYIKEHTHTHTHIHTYIDIYIYIKL
jgi:hypothetical protein